MEDVLIRFRLVNDEAKALTEWAAKEFRHPRDQVKYIVRRELERLGLLLQPDPLKDKVVEYDEKR